MSEVTAAPTTPTTPAAPRSPNPRQKRFTHRLTLHTIGFRTDQQTQLALEYLQGTLAGDKAGDVCTPSMLCRRALLVYQDHVNRLRSHPALFAQEFKEVRGGTILPYIRHRVTKKSVQ